MTLQFDPGQMRDRLIGKHLVRSKYLLKNGW